MSKLSDSIDRKFTEQFDIDEDWSIETDSGWQPITTIMQTIPYERWNIKLGNGMTLGAADKHIVFDENDNEIYIEDLKIGSTILTRDGPSSVILIENTKSMENMYDISIDSVDHRFYSNGILSHNTTCAAAYLLWYAMFIPDSTILIAAHKYSGSQEIMNRVRFAYENVPNHIRDAALDYNKGSITFVNGSRIISTTTTETTGRGLAISLLYCDEFSYVRPSIAAEFWTSISPTLSTGGKAIITSTPNSDEDTFSVIWKGANRTYDEFGNKRELGDNGFRAFKRDWTAHPDRDETWANEERSRIGDEKFRREHALEFIQDDELLINPIKLASLTGIEPIQKQGQVRWFKLPSPGNTYLTSLDPSLGTGGDHAAIQVFELPSLEQVAEWQHNRTVITNQIKILKEINLFIRDCAGDESPIYWSIENNTIGEAALIVIEEMGEENIPGTFLTEPAKMGNTRRHRKGFTTTQKSKISACSKIKTLIESDRIKINSKALISELKAFIAIGGSYKAKIGEHDDLVLATLLNIRMGQYISSYDERIYNQFSEKFEMEKQVPLPFYVLR